MQNNIYLLTVTMQKKPSLLWLCGKEFFTESLCRKIHKLKLQAALNGPSQSTLAGHAAVNAFSHRDMLKQHLPLRKSLLYISVACYSWREIMYAEVRKTVWTAAWFPWQRLSRWSAPGAGWRECAHEAWCNEIVSGRSWKVSKHWMMSPLC